MPSKQEYYFVYPTCSDEITPEHLTLSAWYSRKRPVASAYHVRDTTAVLFNRIKPYISAAKAQNPDTTLDIMLLRIYLCIYRSLPKLPIEYALTLANRMHLWVKTWESLHENQSVDKNDLQIFCYVAFGQPELNLSLAIDQVDVIQRKISIYIEVAKKEFPQHRKLDINKIQLYLWAGKKYSYLTPSEAVEWVNGIELKYLARKIERVFPSSFPFSIVRFCALPGGVGGIIVSAKTFLSFPHLTSILPTSNIRPGTLKYTVDIEFHLEKGNTSESIMEKTKSLFDMLETTLNAQIYEDKKIFEEIRQEFINEVKVFVDYYRKEFPGLKYYQRKEVPGLKYYHEISPTIPHSAAPSNENLIIYGDVIRLDYVKIQKKLAAGADPNLPSYSSVSERYFDNPLEHIASEGVGEWYDVRLAFEGPSEEDFKSLYTYWDVTRKRPTVLITYEFGGYKLYWSEDMKATLSRNIAALPDIHYLNTVREEYLKRGKLPRLMEEKLDEIIRPYLKRAYKKQYNQKAEHIIKIATLLMSYGGDPRKGNPTDIDSQTPIERVINNSMKSRSNHPTNKKLLKSLLRLMLHGEKRFYWSIPSIYKNHYLAKIIIGYQQSLVNGHKIPPSLQAVEFMQDYRRPRVKITNAKKASVYLESIPLHRLDQFPQAKQDIMDLCKKTFLKDVKMSEEELEKYVEKKLEATHQHSAIDLLYNEEGRVVAFNIADMVLPQKPDEAVLHYIRLAVTDDSVRDDFKKLTSIIHYQRILFLMAFYEAMVLTAFAAASALSYILVADLRIYPKYQCLNDFDQLDFDRLRLYDSSFSGGNMFFEDGRCYFESDLHYKAQPKIENAENQQEVARSSDIDCRVYNDVFAKSGYSTLVAFWSTPDNIKKLSKKINPQLQNLTFEEAAKIMERLNPSTLTPSASL